MQQALVLQEPEQYQCRWNINLNLDAGTTGLVQIAGTSSGNVEIAGGVSATGCTITNATGDLSCSGDITGANTGTVGYWSRDDATQTLTTATDWDNITLGGLLTATGGATIAGTTNVNTSGSSDTNIGTGSYSGNLTIGNSSANISITDNNWSIAANGAASFVGVNANAGLIQGSGGLTLSGTTNINTTGSAATNIGTGTSTGTITIGRTTGTDLALNDANWNISGSWCCQLYHQLVQQLRDPVHLLPFHQRV